MVWKLNYLLSPTMLLIESTVMAMAIAAMRESNKKI